MGKSCFVCDKKFGIVANYNTYKDFKKNKLDVSPEGFGEKDVICFPCGEEQVVINSDRVIQWSRDNLSREEFDNLFNTDPLHIRVMEKYLKDHPVNNSSHTSSPIGGSTPNPITSSPQKPQNITLSSNTSSEQLRQLTNTLHDQYKSQWDKNGVVQIKTPSLAILQRKWGQQVQFIVACDQLSKEGYRLMAIDEGKEGSSGGIAGGVNAYFYFQKMDFVR